MFITVQDSKNAEKLSFFWSYGIFSLSFEGFFVDFYVSSCLKFLFIFDFVTTVAKLLGSSDLLRRYVSVDITLIDTKP